MTYTVEEFADKVAWEGGVWDALFDYGLGAEDLEDKTSELYRLLVELDKLKPSLNQLIADIEEIIGE